MIYLKRSPKFISLSSQAQHQFVRMNERSFSALKRVKNYLCSTMSGDRLNDCMLLAVERDLTDRIDLKKLAIIKVSVVDLLVGIIGLPLLTFVLASNAKGDANCTVSVLAILAAHLITGYSMITLSALNFERYFGIIHPLLHHRNIKRLKIAIFILLFLITTAYVYIRIFLTAKKRSPLQNIPDATAGESKESTMKTKKDNLREIKLAKSCCIIVFLFIFSFLPLSIVNIFLATPLGAVKFRIMQACCVTIVMLNPTLNSVVFFWTRPLLRKAKKIFRKICF
ncbi:zinc finger MYM-type 1-like [Paramuricea clavata]|uniref:Zinc finger MYM-type 1-like n=1 Tax=Paramuricea clavata TaxID=317549 RepID=A0A7D9INF9_PARCT|nr:zinc finger MYM-type 1-like [Paramuricea clavata]